MSRVVAAIEEFFHQHQITGPGIVAVSGGADSVALLRGLLLAGVRVAAVAHFNHQLRGAESDADEAFVTELARQQQCPLLLATAPIRQLAHEQRQNLEATARIERYQFLTDRAEQSGASWIATGHTANDQAETVLHRLIRGTGLAGLRGIASVRSDRVPVIRPLIEVERHELLKFLQELQQPFRQDSSNSDLSFTRNRIRAEVVPLLRSFNPSVIRSLGRLAEQAEEFQAYLDEQMASALQRCLKPRAGGLIILDAREFQKLSGLLRVGVMRQIYASEGWPAGAMTAAHWKRLADLTPGDYPDRIGLKVAGFVVQLGPRAS